MNQDTHLEEINFVPAKSPEAINMMPGKYVMVKLDAGESPSTPMISSSSDDEDFSDENSPETSSSSEDESSDQDLSSDDSRISSTDPTEHNSSDGEQESPKAFYDFNESQKDRGTNNKVIKSWNPEVMGKSIVGLENRGVTCYMNSAIQAFFHIPAIAKYLVDVYAGEYSPTIKSSMVTTELANLYKRVTDKKRRVYPARIIKRLEDINCMMSVWQQEDSHEYYMSLMNRLQSDSCPKGVKLTNSIIYDIFAGSIEQKIVCKTCKTDSTTFQDFYDLAVGLHRTSSGKINLEDAIRDYFKPETLNPKKNDGYQCSKCKQVTKAFKFCSIYTAPEYLTVHLKRFKFDGSEAEKVQEAVSYPINLSLDDYSARKEHLRYKLIAIIVHEGRSLSSGHYIAICRQPAGGWAVYDDDEVHSISENKVKKQENAYILIYSRLTAKPKEKSKENVRRSPKRRNSTSELPSTKKHITKLNARKHAHDSIDSIFKKS